MWSKTGKQNIFKFELFAGEPDQTSKWILISITLYGSLLTKKHVALINFPKNPWTTWLWRHTSCPISKHFLHMVCNTILLWWSNTSVVSHYAFSAAEIIEVYITIFKHIGCPKILNFSFSLALNHGILFNKRRKCFIFYFQKKCPYHSLVIIKQIHEVSGTTFQGNSIWQKSECI